MIHCWIKETAKTGTEDMMGCATAPTDDFYPPKPHTALLSLLACDYFLWRYQTKVVFPGNGATRNTISSAGWPLCCHLHAWTAVNDRHAPSRLCHKPGPPNSLPVLISTYALHCLPASFMNTTPCPSCSITWVNMEGLKPSIWVKW